jgi:signal transduction histidine kinase
MHQALVDDVIHWAQDAGLPLAEAVLLSDTEVRWEFSSPVDPAISLLLNAVFEARRMAEEERFLLDGLIHELRNGLATIVAHLDLLQQTPEPAARLLSIRRAADRMARQLEWAAARHLPAAVREFSLESLWHQVLADLEPEWRPRHIVWTFGGADYRVVSDPDRVAQILFNLAKNAAAASPDHSTIRAEIRRNAHQVRFVLTNPGAGLDPAAQRAVLEARPSTTQLGHGYGLAICKRLADSLQAQLLYESSPDLVSFSLIFSSPSESTAGKDPAV